MEQERVLFACAVDAWFAGLTPADRRRVAAGAGLRLPAKARERPDRVREAVLRAALGAEGEDLLGPFVARSAQALCAMEPARRANVLRAHPPAAALLQWQASRTGPAELAEETLSALSEEERERCQAAVAAARAEVEALAERLRARRQDALRAQAEAASRTAEARRQAEAARSVAAREAGRAARAARQAAERIAAAEARASAAEAEVGRLRALLAERDERLGSLAADFQRRLALERAAADQAGGAWRAALPLAGLRVLVLGDPDRAVAYRAEALALGAAEVDFLDGRAAPGERLAAGVRHADLVVLIAAWAKHRAEWTARRHLRPEGTFVVVRQAGLRAFREALGALGRREDAAGSGAAR